MDSIGIKCFAGLLIVLALAICTLSAAPHSKHQNENHPARQHHKYASLLHSVADYRRKLQEQGLINSIEEAYGGDDDDDSYAASFNELEMLQLIPVIIAELTARRVEYSDRVMLRAVFGSLWPLMLEEADRRQKRRAARSMELSGAVRDASAALPAIDPVLKQILRAQRDWEAGREQDAWRRLGGGATTATGASAEEAVDEHSMAAKLAKMWHEHSRQSAADVEPAQRILKLAAVLIHEQMQRREQRKLRKRKSREAARTKRSVAAEEEEVVGNDEDYNYYDAEVADMFRDSKSGGEHDGDGDADAEDVADLDPTMMALRGDDEQLNQYFYGSPRSHRSNLFQLAEEHRLRQQQRHSRHRRDDGQRSAELASVAVQNN